jgi:hypothetical protein
MTKEDVSGIVRMQLAWYAGVFGALVALAGWIGYGEILKKAEEKAEEHMQDKIRIAVDETYTRGFSDAVRERILTTARTTS